MSENKDNKGRSSTGGGNKNPLSIKPFKTNKKKIKLNPYMEQGIIPKFGSPFMLIVGSSGSGKTTLALNLFTKPNFYGKYFDRENGGVKYLFSETGKIDDLQNKLGIKKSNIVTKEDQMIETLKKIMDTQERVIKEHSIEKAKKVLIMFEDVTSLKRLLRSEELVRMAVTSRHLNLFPVVIVHKFKSIPRVVRVQCGSLFYFQGQLSEVEAIVEDFGGGNLSKKEMRKLVLFATSPDEENSHPFLFVDTTKPFNERFKKTLCCLLRCNGGICDKKDKK